MAKKRKSKKNESTGGLFSGAPAQKMLPEGEGTRTARQVAMDFDLALVKGAKGAGIRKYAQRIQVRPHVGMLPEPGYRGADSRGVFDQALTRGVGPVQYSSQASIPAPPIRFLPEGEADILARQAAQNVLGFDSGLASKTTGFSKYSKRIQVPPYRAMLPQRGSSEERALASFDNAFNAGTVPGEGTRYHKNLEVREPIGFLPAPGSASGGFDPAEAATNAARMRMTEDAFLGMEGRTYGSTLSDDTSAVPYGRQVIENRLGPDSPSMGSVVAGTAQRNAAEARMAGLMRKSGVKGGGTGLQKGIASLVEKLGMGSAARGASKGMVGKGLGAMARGAIGSPKMALANAAGIAIPAVMGLGSLLNAGVEGVTGDPLWGRPSTDKMIEMEGQIRREQRRRALVEQARARRVADNTANLIRYAPNVAREVMAGRRLPKGAVVIGGTPRLDLMEQLAGEMADGKHRQQDPMAQLMEG